MHGIPQQSELQFSLNWFHLTETDCNCLPEIEKQFVDKFRRPSGPGVLSTVRTEPPSQRSSAPRFFAKPSWLENHTRGMCECEAGGVGGSPESRDFC